jgi:hypothetical protein
MDKAMGAVQTLWSAQAAGPVAMPYQQPALFDTVDKHCHSFSEWWRKTRLTAL